MQRTPRPSSSGVKALEGLCFNEVVVGYSESQVFFVAFVQVCLALHLPAAGQYREQYVPRQCRSPDAQCIDAVMNNPSWSPGTDVALSFCADHFGVSSKVRVSVYHCSCPKSIRYGINYTKEVAIQGEAHLEAPLSSLW